LGGSGQKSRHSSKPGREVLRGRGPKDKRKRKEVAEKKSLHKPQKIGRRKKKKILMRPVWGKNGVSPAGEL